MSERGRDRSVRTVLAAGPRASSLDTTLPPTPLRDLLAADGANVYVYSSDDALLRTVEEAAGEHFPLSPVRAWPMLLRSIGGKCRIVLIDADAVPDGVERALTELEKTAVSPIILVAATREESQRCIGLLAERRIHRLLIKPAAVGITRLLLESAVTRYLQLREGRADAAAQPPPPPLVVGGRVEPVGARRRRSGWTAWAAGAVAVTLAVATLAAFGVGPFGSLRALGSRGALDTLSSLGLFRDSSPAVSDGATASNVSRSNDARAAGGGRRAENGRAVSLGADQLEQDAAPEAAEQPPSVGQQPPSAEQQLPSVRQQPPSAGQQAPPTGQQAELTERQPPPAGQQTALVEQQRAAPPDADPAEATNAFGTADVPEGADALEAVDASEAAEPSEAADASEAGAPELVALEAVDGETGDAEAARAPEGTDAAGAADAVETSDAAETPPERRVAASDAAAAAAVRTEADTNADIERRRAEARRANLIASADRRLAAGQIVAPAEDGALHYLAELQALNSPVPGLRARWARARAAVVQRVRSAIAAEDWETAETWTAALESVDPMPETAAELRNALTIARRQREYLATPAAPSELRLVESAPLEYPILAQRRGIEGWVDVDFVVGTDGRPYDIEVIDSRPGSTFDSAAMQAVSRQRYEPFVQEGHTYERRVQLRISFKLQ